ncbi:hypothetical protein QVD17_16975 [Tagetes erecta]|uniref:Uncharacterized protein n=1 Tax=Tagetes erecta TaxID=13708 RepID=A0AAD8P100_TARER|nr:hypothetical protein QVD17_16974 [Tagetes erecta]KAK1428147.1 hypothetical protein QVD17_16975 [Tagetes erecta]
MSSLNDVTKKILNFFSLFFLGSRRYTEEEVQQMMASYTAPLWRKLNMTPPPFNVEDDGDDDDDDDDDEEEDD